MPGTTCSSALQYLYDVYGPLFTSLLKAANSHLSSLASKYSSTLLYPYDVLPYNWLSLPTSSRAEARPPVPYLASCAISLPLIGLVQLCQYMVTAKLSGLTPDQMLATQGENGAIKGATGHSQGVVTASVIAMGGQTWDDYIQNACEGLKVLFFIGLRG